jgi:5'-methylthioadenosine phosphorylase
MEQKPVLAVIGGSGLYAFQGLADIQKYDLETPFGKPSAPIIVGMLEDRCVAFLARHGIGHHIQPSEVNYRANIFALKQLGVERIVSISACGSLREDYIPGEIAIPDQVFDHTNARKRSFFGDGLVVHVSVAEPFCTLLSQQLLQASQETGVAVHNGGAFITIEGPRFSTRAESNVYRSWGMSLIGMTTSPEVFLAREAEMCYAVMAHVTDYDVWHISEEPVTVDRVVEILNRNTQIAQQAVRNLVRSLPDERSCTCGSALATALITHKEAIPAETRQRLGVLIDKYLD